MKKANDDAKIALDKANASCVKIQTDMVAKQTELDKAAKAKEAEAAKKKAAEDAKKKTLTKDDVGFACTKAADCGTALCCGDYKAKGATVKKGSACNTKTLTAFKKADVDYEFKCLGAKQMFTATVALVGAAMFM